MYEYIKGAVAELTPAYAVLDAGGVGYYIVISLQTYSEIEKLDQAKLFVHYVVREDAQLFYGFATREEREIFRLLIGVSGVGGATARMVLSTYSPAELVSIISTENATLLKNVKGLGLKTSQKIIVELKDKMTGIGSDLGTAAAMVQGDAGNQRYEEAMSALTMLGFNRGASDKLVRNLCKDMPGAQVEDIIRAALKKL